MLLLYIWKKVRAKPKKQNQRKKKGNVRCINMPNYMNWNSKPVFELPCILRVKPVRPDCVIFLYIT